METETSTMKEDDEIVSQIERCMRARLQHFKDQADSLTFEGVRRLLETDLGLETYALDVHKRFIKHLLEKYLSDAEENDKNVYNASVENGEDNVSVSQVEAGSPTKYEAKKDVKEEVSGNEEKTEDSPVMGLLTGEETTKLAQTPSIKKKAIPTESTIKNGLWKRASYLIANIEKITMAGVRRLLEKDLELEEKTLDPFKMFISKQLDEVINSPNVSKSTSGSKKKISGSSPRGTGGDRPESSDGESDEVEGGTKSDKKVSHKSRLQNSEGPKRKRPEKETNVSKKKQSKHAKTASEELIETEDDGNASEDNQSQSSSEKPVKKKEVSTAAYGKHVERLKSIIKSCGLSIAPSIYKKVKQVSDNKREAFLIKELEAILSREGLSRNPSEKEIKDLRKRKQREKELEGIDMSNIVSSSRRRTSASIVAPPPPKPKSPKKSDGDDIDTDNEEDDNTDDEDNDGDDSQSDEFNEDDEDSD